MTDSTFMSGLRFSLSDAEVESYHRDGVIGPYAFAVPCRDAGGTDRD